MIRFSETYKARKKRQYSASFKPQQMFKFVTERFVAEIDGRRAFRFLLMAFTALLIGACYEIDEQSSTDDSPLGDSLKISATPDQESEGTVIALYDGDLKTSDIYADKIWKYTLKDSSVVRGLQVDFYDSAQVITTHLVADSGVILEIKQIMVAIGDVVVTNADSSILLTEELIWNGMTELITSDSFVTFISDNDTIQGTGLRTDRSMRKVKILHQVSGTIGDEKSR